MAGGERLGAAQIDHQRAVVDERRRDRARRARAGGGTPSPRSEHGRAVAIDALHAREVRRRFGKIVEDRGDERRLRRAAAAAG